MNHYTSSGSLTVPTIVLNSVFAVYFLFLTSASAGSFRPKLINSDIEQIPIPSVQSPSVRELSEMSLDDIDAKTFDFYGLKEPERILVEDFFEITLKDFKGGETSPGRQAALAGEADAKVVLGRYCEAFLAVLHAAFGSDKAVSATIFTTDSPDPLPYCLVALHLDWPGREPVVLERLAKDALVDWFYALDRQALDSDPEEGGVFYQRVARVYQTPTIDGIKIPTVYLFKPNQLRYWTRSAAFRDADDVAADILLSDERSERQPEQDEAHA